MHGSWWVLSEPVQNQPVLELSWSLSSIPADEEYRSLVKTLFLNSAGLWIPGRPQSAMRCWNPSEKNSRSDKRDNLHQWLQWVTSCYYHCLFHLLQALMQCNLMMCLYTRLHKRSKTKGVKHEMPLGLLDKCFSDHALILHDVHDTHFTNIGLFLIKGIITMLKK